MPKITHRGQKDPLESLHSHHHQYHGHFNIFNPSYPDEILEHILAMTPNRKKYLDLASGIGTLFFDIMPYINTFCVWNDEDPKKEEVAKRRMRDLELMNAKIPLVEFLLCDANKIDNILLNMHKNQKSIPCRFDLITIGQALHRFEPTSFVKYIENHLLDVEGTLSICSYFASGIEFNYPEDPLFALTAQLYFEEFTKAINSYYEYPRKLLETGYTAIHFEKFFNRVARYQTIVKTDVTLPDFLTYCRLSNGYKRFISSHHSNKAYIDPASHMGENLRRDLDTYCHKAKVLIKEKPIKIKMLFHLINLTNRFPKL